MIVYLTYIQKMILSVEINHLFLDIRKYLLDDSWGLQKYQF